MKTRTEIMKPRPAKPNAAKLKTEKLTPPPADLDDLLNREIKRATGLVPCNGCGR